MRHTHATLLAGGRREREGGSERLGHASIKVTLDTYAHVLPSMQKAAADRISDCLANRLNDSRA